MLETILNLLMTGQERVVIQSPYLVTNKQIAYKLEQIGLQVPDKTILTNSIGSSPNFPAYSAYLGDRDKYIQWGYKVWEYQSDHSIHGKTYLVDDRLSVVGSCNLDPRSGTINTELMLVIDSVQLNQQLTEVINGYISTSLQVGQDGLYVQQDDVEEIMVSNAKQIVMKILSYPIRLVKFLI